MLSPAFLGSAINSAAGAQEDMILLEVIRNTPNSSWKSWSEPLTHPFVSETDVVFLTDVAITDFVGRADETNTLLSINDGSSTLSLSRAEATTNTYLTYTLTHARFPSAISVKHYPFTNVSGSNNTFTIDPMEDAVNNRRLAYISSKFTTAANTTSESRATQPFIAFVTDTTIRVRIRADPQVNLDYNLYIVELPPLPAL